MTTLISSPICVLCNDPITGPPANSSNLAQPMHQECALREVLGGIGHLLDHYHFCVDRQDPDAGLPYRVSAILVDAYVQAVGTKSAVSRSTKQ